MCLKITVNVVEHAEGAEHLNEGQAVLLAGFLDERRGEDHHHGADLIQQHPAERRVCRIHPLRQR